VPGEIRVAAYRHAVEEEVVAEEPGEKDEVAHLHAQQQLDGGELRV
jgi:hypothetical protein